MPRRFELLHHLINFSFNKYRENNSNCEAWWNGDDLFSSSTFSTKSSIAKLILHEIRFTSSFFFKIDRVDRQGPVDRRQEDGRLGGRHCSIINVADVGVGSRFASVRIASLRLVWNLRARDTRVYERLRFHWRRSFTPPRSMKRFRNQALDKPREIIYVFRPGRSGGGARRHRRGRE